MKLFKNESKINYIIVKDEKTNKLGVYNNNLLVISLIEKPLEDFEYNVHNNKNFYGVTIIHDMDNNPYGIWKDKSSEEHFITKLGEV